MSNTYTGLSSTTRLASSGTAAHGGLFALNRLVASKNGGGGRNYNDSSDYTANLRRNAIGKSSYANSSNTHVTNFLNTSQNYKLVIPDSGNAVILPAEQNLREYSFSTPTLFNVALETP